jgi:hypothetical protein
MQFLRYWFYPNPGFASYDKPTMIALISLSVALILASLIVRLWRRRMGNPITKKLSRSWPLALFWFGVVGIILVVSRVATIQFFAMRALWVFWALAFAGYIFLQIRQFRTRHYEVIPQKLVIDPREKYLPGKRR